MATFIFIFIFILYHIVHIESISKIMLFQKDYIFNPIYPANSEAVDGTQK